MLAAGTTTWAGGPPGPAPKLPAPGERLQEQLRKPPLPLAECRDPAAISLKYRVIAKDPKWPATQGRIRIEGVVKNVGNAVFESDPRQAVAELLEEPLGGRATVKAQRNIARLDPGATLDLGYERSWDTATEFPPNYILQITYDPDIYIDANKKNDDCNKNNNRTELTGAAINATWPR